MTFKVIRLMTSQRMRRLYLGLIADITILLNSLHACSRVFPALALALKYLETRAMLKQFFAEYFSALLCFVKGR